MSAIDKERIIEMAMVVSATVNRIADVYASFNLPQYQKEAEVLRKIAQEDLNLEQAKNGSLLDGNTVADLVDNSDPQDTSGGWVLTLATMLGFSFKGIYLPSLSTKEGVEIEHPRLPFKARLIERFVNQDGHIQNSLTLRTNLSSRQLCTENNNYE